MPNDAPFFVPFLDNQHFFIGRSRELHDLGQLLQTNSAVAITGITGMGGIGKTQLAVAYAYRAREAARYPDGIFWLNGANPLHREFAALGQKLGQTHPRTHLLEMLRHAFNKDEFDDLAFDLRIDPNDLDLSKLSNQRRELVAYMERHGRLPELERHIEGTLARLGAPEESLDEQVQQTFAYLRQNPRALLLVDNLERPASLQEPVSQECVPAQLPCTVLFTTRSRQVGGFREMNLDVLPEPAALNLLLQGRSSPPDDPQQEAAQAVCRLLGRLPLALTVAAAFLREWPEVSLAAFAQRLQEEGALATLDEEFEHLRAEALLDVQLKAVTAVLQAQWNKLESEPARLLLRVAGQMPEAAVLPAARLGLLAGVETVAKPGRPADLERCLKQLERACLVEKLQTDQVRLHPLVREFAKQQTPMEQKNAFRLACAGRLLATYEQLPLLEQQCARRGIDALQEDLLAALELTVPSEQYPVSSRELPEGGQKTVPDANTNTDTPARLQTLLRLLRREVHTLRGWQPPQQPAFFAQQIASRIQDLGLERLLPQVAGWLQHKTAHLRRRWAAKQESLALEYTLSGHSDWVSAVAVTPDGRRAVSASADRTLKVWNLDSGTAERTLSGHSALVRAVAVTPDGRRAVSASDDSTLKVWNLGNGTAERTLSGHSAWVLAVAVTPDGRRAVSASADRTLKVWNLGNGTAERTLFGHSAEVRAVAVTPDGRRAVSASDDRTLKVWNLDSGTAERTLSGHSTWVRAVAVTPDGRRAVSASYDRTLKVWNLDSGTAERTLSGHSTWVRAVAVIPDGRRAVSASSDSTLKVWNLDSGTAERTLSGHSAAVLAVAVTPDGRRAVSASYDRTLKVWNLDSGTAERTLSGHSAAVLAVAVTPDGRRAVSASSDSTLKVWNLDSGTAERTLSGHSDWVNAVAVTPDGRRAVSASSDSTLKVWNLDSGTAERTLSGHSDSVWAVAVTPDGRRAVSASVDSLTLKVWNLDSGTAERTLSGHSDWVNAVAVTPDGRRAVSASRDRTLKVWNLDSGTAERTLSGHSAWVNAVAVTPDGRRAVSASPDSTLKVWNLDSGTAERTLSGHSAAVLAVAVTPDGRRAVSASDDRTLKVWNLDSGTEIISMPLDGTLYCVAVALDGRTILAGDGAGNVYCLELVG